MGKNKNKGSKNTAALTRQAAHRQTANFIAAAVP
jgi:hypothetical protein